MKLYLGVTEGGLVPAYESGYVEMKRLKIGSVLECEVKRPRNLKFHKKFMALVRVAYNNLPERYATTIQSFEDMLKALKMDLKRYTTKQVGDYTIIELESIAFDKMNEDSFERFYQECFRIIREKYIRGLNSEDVEEVILRFM